MPTDRDAFLKALKGRGSKKARQFGQARSTQAGALEDLDASMQRAGDWLSGGLEHHVGRFMQQPLVRPFVDVLGSLGSVDTEDLEEKEQAEQAAKYADYEGWNPWKNLLRRQHEQAQAPKPTPKLEAPESAPRQVGRFLKDMAIDPETGLPDADPLPPGIGQASFLLGSPYARSRTAAVMSATRPALSGKAKRELLDFTKPGVALQDIPGKNFVSKGRGGETLARADVALGGKDVEELRELLPELERQAYETGPAELKRFHKRVEKFEHAAKRQEKLAKEWTEKTRKSRTSEGRTATVHYEEGVDVPEPPVQLPRVRMAAEGDNPASSTFHEMGHMIEWLAPNQTRERMRSFANVAEPTRPELGRDELLEYYLQQEAAGERGGHGLSLEYLLKNKDELRKKFNVSDEGMRALIAERKLRVAMEEFGIDTAKLEGKVPRMKGGSPEEAKWIEDQLGWAKRWKLNSLGTGKAQNEFLKELGLGEPMTSKMAKRPGGK